MFDLQNSFQSKEYNLFYLNGLPLCALAYIIHDFAAHQNEPVPVLVNLRLHNKARLVCNTGGEGGKRRGCSTLSTALTGDEGAPCRTPIHANHPSSAHN